MFQVKICGITSLADAQAAADAGADAIGLNFYAKSPRFVQQETAQEICQQLPQLTKVGLFVNESVTTIRQLADQVGFDAIQLHGDEPPETIAELSEFRIIRVLRCQQPSPQMVQQYWLQCQQLNALPETILLDAHAPGQYGGTGQSLDWNQLQSLGPSKEGFRWVLAGGLTPANVAEAISIAHPDGVDTASGVEIQPGQKDPQQVAQFVQAARTALAEVADKTC